MEMKEDMYKDMTLKELISLQEQQEITIVDVRSPSEFDDANIPGSLNIPVFNDEERAEVGTIYKQLGPDLAQKRGLEIFSTKLPDFVAAFQEIKGEKVVYCWRGGMRSKTAATMTDLAGMSVSRLTGGYRAYRNWVVETLHDFSFTPKVCVLNGYTGTGKTTILRQLKQDNYPVIDLEEMASHRGSIFGQIGLEPNNQKTFDSLFVSEMLRYRNSPFVIMEGESKRIGRVLLPEKLLTKKAEGIQLFISLPIEERVRLIMEEYEPWNHQHEVLEAFRIIKKRIHTPIAKEIETNLMNGSYHIAIQLLLEYYYDPRYDHSINQYTNEKAFVIHANTVDEAISKIKEVLASEAKEQKV
jgi:tRNA 2-selenouridine synthase